MENITKIFTAIDTIWDSIFAIHWPGLSISFKAIYIGSFIILVSVYILKWIFGIGVSVSRSRLESSIRIKKSSSSSPSYTYSVGVGSRVTHSNGFTELYTRTK